MALKRLVTGGTYRADGPITTGATPSSDGPGSSAMANPFAGSGGPSGSAMANPFAGSFTGAGGPGGSSGGAQPTWASYYAAHPLEDPALAKSQAAATTAQNELAAGQAQYALQHIGQPLAALQQAGGGGGGGESGTPEANRLNAERNLRLQAELASESDRRRASLEAGAAAQSAGFASESDRRRAALEAEAEARRFGQVSPFLSSLTSQTLSRTGGSNAEMEQAARSAAFARAKDTAGQIARSALAALRENMAERNVGGGGLEGFETARSVLAPAAGGLQEINREQLLQELAHAQHVADMGYTGGIQQRGQNLTLAPALLSLIRGGGGLY